jgi:hypothetical protein
MGSAIVSVAAVGVSPTDSSTGRLNASEVVHALDVVGGTPTNAGETPALPEEF